MKRLSRAIVAVCALALGAFAWAADQATAPADAPAGSTGLCKDGTYWSGATKKGACKGHKGVKDWYVAADAGKGESKTQAKAESKSAAPATAPAATPAPAPAPTASAAPAQTKPSAPAKAAAPGGGPGLVWVNSSSKVYHCQGDKWYGTTKAGEYMSEADAKAKGNRAAGGKACT